MKHLEDLHAAYTAKFPTSRVWAETSSRLLPGGVAHDGRATTPFPLFITSAAGPRKHDLDGNDLIDYWMGHGALMLGHSPPAIVDAVVAQSRARYALRSQSSCRGAVGAADRRSGAIG